MKKLTVRSDDTDIFIFNHPSPIELNQRLEKDICLCGDKQNRTTNVKALMTHWDMFNYGNSFKELVTWIERSFNDCQLDEFHKQNDFKLNSLWGMVYEKGDHAIEHNHLPSFYSFVYCVKSSNFSSPLIFKASSTYIKMEEGKLIFFPSHLIHYVPLQKYDDKRITISGNILCVE